MAQAKDVGCFSADFFDDMVIVGGKNFFVGSFIVQMLNDFYENDNAARISAFNFHKLSFLRNFKTGYIVLEETEKVREEWRHQFKTVRKIKPCSLLNFNNEEQRVNDLLSEESIKITINYLLYRGKQAQKCENEYSYIDLSGLNTDKEYLADGAERLDDLERTLTFYERLGTDMGIMREMALMFMSGLNDLQKRDESSLIKLAMKCFDSVYSAADLESWNRQNRRIMQADFEYVGVKSTSNSKKLVTARRMFFSRFLDFLLADFYEGLHRGHYPKKCPICGRYFFMQNARNQQFCEGYDPNDEQGRKCAAVAASRKRYIREDPKANPEKALLRTTLGTINKYKHRGKYTPEFAELAKNHVQSLYQTALSDGYYSDTQYKKDMSISAIEKWVKENN